MRTIGAVFLASTLIATSAFAATDAAAPLAPGKPAGVKQAQERDNTLLLVLGVGVVAAGIALVASGNGKSVVGATNTCTNIACTSTTSTSTSTSTSP
jgi:hypothetical protein